MIQMPLYRVFYAGIFEGNTENEAEVKASLNREELMHIKTVPTQQEDKKDSNATKELVLFSTDEEIKELLEDVDPEKDRRIRDLDFETLFLILRKDCDDGDFIIQSAIKGHNPKERVAVISFNIDNILHGDYKETGIIHCIPSFVGTEMANYIRIKSEKDSRR